MYFIEDGTVSIRLNQDDGEVEISRLSKGAYFGELALVTHRPRAASAYAVENVKVACKYTVDELQISKFLKTKTKFNSKSPVLVRCFNFLNFFSIF